MLYDPSNIRKTGTEYGVGVMVVVGRGRTVVLSISSLVKP